MKSKFYIFDSFDWKTCYFYSTFFLLCKYIYYLCFMKGDRKYLKNVILIQKLDEETNEIVTQEVWGSLTEACRQHGFNHKAIGRYKFPFSRYGWVFNKIPFNEKNVNQ